MGSRFSKSQPTTKKKPQSAQRPLRIFFSAIFAVFAVSSLFVGIAQTLPERARAEALARRAAERLQALQREADRLAADERTLLGDLRKLDVDRQIKAEELKRVDADATRVQSELDKTIARMDSLQASARSQVPELQQRLVEIYKLGQARYLRLLLSTPDLRGLGQATRTVAALAKLDRDRVATHAKTVADLETERRALQTRRGELA